MSVTLTNKEALLAADALRAIGTVTLPIKAAYRIAKMKRALTPVLESCDEVRKQLVDKYGKRDDAGKLIEEKNGDRVTYPLNDAQAFEADYAELMKQSQTIDVLPIGLDLFDKHDTEVSADVLFGLGPLFTDTAPA